MNAEMLINVVSIISDEKDCRECVLHFTDCKQAVLNSLQVLK